MPLVNVAQPSNPARSKHPKPPHTQQGVMHGTPATRHMHSLALSGSTGAARARRRRSSSPKASAAPHRKGRASAARSGKAHLVKGSAAAKRYMSKLRKMVGKKKAA